MQLFVILHSLMWRIYNRRSRKIISIWWLLPIRCWHFDVRAMHFLVSPTHAVLIHHGLLFRLSMANYVTGHNYHHIDCLSKYCHRNIMIITYIITHKHNIVIFTTMLSHYFFTNSQTIDVTRLITTDTCVYVAFSITYYWTAPWLTVTQSITLLRTMLLSNMIQ